ncbi:MAG: GAF domain-containing protein [Candidatus Aquilonibacter sp.]
MRLAFQGLIAVLVLAGLVEGVFAQLTPNDAGYFGMTLSHYDPAGTIVASVAPGSPTAVAGIHPGDRIAIVTTPANMIVNLVTEPGDILMVQDGARTVTLRAAVASGSSPLTLVVILDAAKLAFLAMAILVAWRRPDDSAARALALFFACFGFGLGADFGLFHPLWLRLFAVLLAQTAFYIGTLAALAFACRFPTAPERGFRATISRCILPLAAFGVVVGEGVQLFGFLEPELTRSVRTLLPIPFLACFLAVAIAIVLVFWNSYRSSTGSDRVRIRWVLLTFAFGFSGLAVYFVGIILNGRNTGVLPYAAFTTFVIPFGLAYVILRHRVLDIGFVINRAVVYAGVSIIVVVTFIIFEWLVGRVVETNSRTSDILQLGAALVLGLSIRPIHNRVDRWVDDLFFRERHAAEAAVRRFAHEALLITAQSDLIAKTVEIAQRNMHLQGCAFYTARDGRYVPLQSTFEVGPSVSENDYAVLGMRTWHKPVELHDIETQLPGDLALPMTVRGRLAGFLLCGEKSSHEAFAPDEREALALLARDAGIALDSLRISALERAAGATGGGEVAL